MDGASIRITSIVMPSVSYYSGIKGDDGYCSWGQIQTSCLYVIALLPAVRAQLVERRYQHDIFLSRVASVRA